MNIKEKIIRSKVKQWEVAEKMGVSEFTLSRYLRRPERLEGKRLEDIEKALDEVIKEDKQ